MRKQRRLIALGGLAIVAGCSGSDPAGTLEIRVLDVPAAAGSGQPDLAPGPDGLVVLSWLEPGAGGEVAFRHSSLREGVWSSPRTVVQGDELFVNWADVPSVVPITADSWIAHWLKLKPESFGAYDVAIATSQDAGTTWSAPVLLNDDGTDTEHGFVTLFPWGDGAGAVWLDGRQLAEWSFDAPDALLGTELRFARLTLDGEVRETGEIDALVCDCCQTDVAMTASGPLVIYRDRTEEEIRDVVVRAYDGGTWQAPISLGAEGWRIEGCPVNGPAIAARAADVAAAWFTAADDKPRVRFARSSDGGRSFGAALDIDAVGAFGQVDVVMLEDAVAVVTWWRRAESGRTALVSRTVSRDGALGPITTIAENEIAQPLDVPEAISAGDALLVTWTGIEDGGRVRAALARNLPLE